MRNIYTLTKIKEEYPAEKFKIQFPSSSHTYYAVSDIRRDYMSDRIIIEVEGVEIIE